LRLDIYISQKEGFSRSKAQSLLKNGQIEINGKTNIKSSEIIENEIEYKILKERVYVSRAGDKLNLFLDNLSFDLKGLKALDIGASTGGFTEVLIEKGVDEVYALDVGTLQLSQKLRENPKIKSIENMDIRNFKTDEKFDLITCDVSFISLRSILSEIKRLAKDRVILLFKPQFEVGREIKRDRNGVVKDEKAIKKSLEDFLELLKDFHFSVERVEKSLLLGKKGNIEYFISLKCQNIKILK
jgi:23S rRNA (cytidine1920-2'-O)/16S rRNA (cytidine1409-2'-O)-methyltransferase